MASSTGTRKHWAILIGVSYYSRESTPLLGPVRDVEILKQYLQSAQIPIQIQTFTSSAPPDLSISVPSEDPREWPTLPNIQAAVESIENQAEPGDQVYIHFSGHGSQANTKSQDHGNHQTGDVMLVLFDPIVKAKYLRGLMFAQWLKSLVDKQLLVTVVLDCCFSGSVVRHGGTLSDNVRFQPYNKKIDELSPHLGDEGTSIGKSTYRDSRLLHNWLIDPSGYTIFAACGPHEIARVLKIDGREHNGALTYLLLETLRWFDRFGISPTQHAVYQHLCIRFHAECPVQTPMRYGREDLMFLGGIHNDPDISAPMVTRSNNEWILHAGAAHGVCIGDRFALAPEGRGKQISSGSDADTITAIVTAIRPTEASLTFTTNAPMDTPNWKASLVSAISEVKLRVGVCSSILDLIDGIDISEESIFFTATKASKDDQTSQYYVDSTKPDSIAILDPSRQKLPGLPFIPFTLQGVRNAVRASLDHLGKYKRVEAIENRCANRQFASNFRIQLAVRGEAVANEVQIVQVKEHEEVTFTIKNRGPTELFVYVFNLKPTWAIDDLLSEDGQGDHIRIPPQNMTGGHSHTGEEEFTIEMSIPEGWDDEVLHCEDVIKIFVTSQHLTLSSLRLNSLADTVEKSMEKDNNLSGELQKPRVSTMRGDEHWEALNFIIRTIPENRSKD